MRCVIARKCLELFFSSSCHRTVPARRNAIPGVEQRTADDPPRTSWTHRSVVPSLTFGVYKRHPNCLVLSSTKHPPEVFDLAPSQNGTNLLREGCALKIDKRGSTGAEDSAENCGPDEGEYWGEVMCWFPQIRGKHMPNTPSLLMSLF